MSTEISDFISNYGYLAIFFLIFIQELGIPNPIPNELVLMFCGYLTFTQILSLPFVIVTAISADIIGTNILYLIFYYLGSYILKRKPRWFPVSENKINTLSERVSKGGVWTLYICRMTPFVRGYTSIIAGLLQIKHKVFIPVTIISAIVWASTCVITGYLLGPYWSYAGNILGQAKYVILASALLIILIIVLVKYFKKQSK